MSKLEIYACSGVESSASKAVARNIENAGWQQNATLRKYLGTSKDGGCAEYFLYIFIPDSELGKYNTKIYNKRKLQLKTFAYVREVFTNYNYGTEQDLINVIRDGIETTFDAPVERVLEDIRTGKRDAVGDPVIIAAIISAVVTIILAVISGVIQYCQNVAVAKYTAPSYAELEASVPTSDDVLETPKKKGLLFVGLAAAGVALWKFIKKN